MRSTGASERPTANQVVSATTPTTIGTETASRAPTVRERRVDLFGAAAGHDDRSRRPTCSTATANGESSGSSRIRAGASPSRSASAPTSSAASLAATTAPLSRSMTCQNRSSSMSGSDSGSRGVDLLGERLGVLLRGRVDLRVQRAC